LARRAARPASLVGAELCPIKRDGEHRVAASLGLETSSRPACSTPGIPVYGSSRAIRAASELQLA
jgi:hypothetical protein